MTPSGSARVVHRGTFDVDNFGDLLFPHVLRHRLVGLSVDIEHQSPTGGNTRYADALRTQRTRDEAGVAAVIVGGGNIIKTGNGGLANYERYALGDSYSALWASSAFAPPHFWMAVGVPREPDALTTARLMATPRAAYASARDDDSVTWLASAGHSAVCRPDSAFSIAEIWPRHRVWRRPREAGVGSPYVSVSLKARDLYPSPTTVARSVQEFARRLGARIMLIPLGHCHGDQAVASEVLGRLPSSAAMESPRSLQETCGLLAGAVAHVGSSLHGGVVSASYGVPVAWISRTQERGLPKLRGALRWMPPSTLLLRSWPDLVDSADGAVAEERAQLGEDTQLALRQDAHDLRSLIAALPKSPTRPTTAGP